MYDAATDGAAFDEAVVFLSHFKDLADPRQHGKVTYPLDEMLLLRLLAVLVGAECFTEIGLFGVNCNSQAPPSRPLRREQVDEFSGRHGQRPQDVDPMLSGGGDDRANGSEDLGSAQGSEAAGDLHSQFHHADVLFGLVVRERHVEILGKAQHVGFAVAQAQQQIMPGPPGRSAPRAGRADQRRLAHVQGKPHG
jgi:hypothetical protein